MNMMSMVAATLLGVAVAGGAVAQGVQPPAGAPSFAVMDTLQVVNQTNAAKRALETLKTKRDAAQAKIDQLEAPLLAKQKQLQETGSTLTPDKLRAEQEAFRKQAEAFRAEAAKIQEDLQDEGMAQRKRIADTVSAATAELAKEKGYTLVLPKAMVVFSAAGVPDISAEVLKRANAKLDK